MSKFIKITVILIILLIDPSNLFAQNETDERAQWFVNDRFGMFIHWGAYSGAEGIWKGEKLRYDNDYAEWIQYRNRIDKKEYLGLLNRFDWDQIDPEEWVLLVKKAGMKYVTITAKHHDGFALWKSDVSDYNIFNYSNGRDIIKEISEACKKHGIKLGLYYSHWVDWEHEYGWDHTNEINELKPEHYDEYWQQKVIPQMRELLTNYGDIGIIWFDMWVHHSNTIVTKDQLVQLKNLIRDLQPNCLINSRLGLSIEEDNDVDFRTMGDNQLGSQKLEYPWQTAGTVAHSWGFHALENNWKSTTSLLRALVNNVSLNGNYMLNIGPRANGEVPIEISQRLEAIGTWLEKNGEAIYGSSGYDLPKNQHDWGKITYKKTADRTFRVYLHLDNWPLSRTLKLTGIATRPMKVYQLADKEKRPLKYEQNNLLTSINLPKKSLGKYIHVLVVEYDQVPIATKGLVAIGNENGFSLNSENANVISKGIEKKAPERFGSIPKHAIIEEEQQISWKIFIDQPTSLKADVSYSFQNANNASSVVLELAGQQRELQFEDTGKTVGEPGSNWIIENYKSDKAGVFKIEKPGIYELKANFKIKEGSELKFNWIWLQTNKLIK